MNTAIFTLPQGRIDVPVAGCTVPRDRIQVTGWALEAAAPFRALLVTVNGDVATPAQAGLPSPEVAGWYRDTPHASSAGWRAAVSLRHVGDPQATIGLLGLTRGGDWYELARSTVLLESSASAGAVETRSPRAVFTIVQNESVFLPVWLRHYRRHFEAADIFILDHDSTDGSTETLGGQAHRVPIHCAASFDHYWMRNTVERFQALLLQSYRTVLFAEVDELVVPTPGRYAGLADYMDRFPGPSARCSGFNVVQVPGEAPLRFDAPLLAQRGFWHPSPGQSKPLLARAPFAWEPGFHRELNFPDVASDPDLYLVHLHRVDYDYCLRRHEAAARRPWSAFDVKHQLGWQNRVFEPEAFRTWYYEGPDLAGCPRLPIPAELRTLL